MADQTGNFIWYELLTTDAACAKAFYDDVIGWNIEPQPSGPMDYRMIAAPDGLVGGLMPLTDEMQAGGARPTWLTYLNVADVDASVAAIVDDGGQVMLPAFDIPGTGRAAMVADPQGAPFYIMAPIPPEGGGESSSFSPTMAGRCAWNELATSDQHGAIDFYTRHFGWRTSGSMPMGEMGDYVFLSHGDVPIGAAMQRQPDGPPTSWIFYFRVGDVAAAAERVTRGGGTVHHGPAEVPGDELVIVAGDPMGAMFGLVGK